MQNTLGSNHLLKSHPKSMLKCRVHKSLLNAVYAFQNMIKRQPCATLHGQCPCEITSEPSALPRPTPISLTKQFVLTNKSELLVLRPPFQVRIFGCCFKVLQ